MSIRLTVALCTYNPRPDLIERAVRAVVAQLGDVEDSAEFLIIDNGSDPPLQNASFLRGFPLEVVREPVQGLSAARETAIRRASGQIILFVDDDNVLSPGYLSSAVAAFADPRLGILGGAIVPEYEVDPPAWLSEFEPYFAVRRYSGDFVKETVALPYTIDFPVGAGLAVLRAVAVEYLADAQTRGRIEDRKGFSLSSGQDIDLDFFALAAGYKLRVMGSLSLAHVIPGKRITEEYISRLLVSNVRSSHELDRKWCGRFGAPLFDYLHGGRRRASLQFLRFLLLSPLSPRYRIKRRIWEEIRRLGR